MLFRCDEHDGKHAEKDGEERAEGEKNVFAECVPSAVWSALPGAQGGGIGGEETGFSGQAHDFFLRATMVSRASVTQRDFSAMLESIVIDAGLIGGVG